VDGWLGAGVWLRVGGWLGLFAGLGAGTWFGAAGGLGAFLYARSSAEVVVALLTEPGLGLDAIGRRIRLLVSRWIRMLV
jgi:hypothetical protein